MRGGGTVLMRSTSSIESPRTAQESLSIYTVLAEPALKAALKWYAVSCFAFENVLFMERVDVVWRNLFVHTEDKRDMRTVKKVADDLVKTFIGSEAPWEISVPAQVRLRLAKAVQEANPADLKADLFDGAYDTVIRDVTRSLTQFQASPLYQSYAQNKEAVDALFGARMKLESSSFPELMSRIRHLYKTTKVVRLEARDSGRYTHACFVGTDLCGYAARDAFIFKFFDLAGKELLVLPVNVFDEAAGGGAGSGQQRVRSLTAPGKVGDDDKPRSSSVVKGAAPSAVSSEKPQKTRFKFSLSKSRTSSASIDKAPAAPKVDPRTCVSALLQDKEGGEWGPIAMSDLKLWWKFHLLQPDVRISLDVSDAADRTWVPLSTYDEVFSQSARVQMVDPTRALGGF